VEVSWDVLEKLDDVATAKVIEVLSTDSTFLALAESETKDILDRDEKDAEALKKGIELAQEKGVLEKIEPAPYTQIDVLGKKADQVADELIGGLGSKAEEGCVVVLVGLSGTGKGTTVDKLKQKLSKATTWSNGNVFRCLTTLACQHCEDNSIEYENMEPVLTAENLAAWMEKISFDKFDGAKWDIKLQQLGERGEAFVSDVANTLLKEPKISKNIPTVAKVTQGEVVKFAADACNKMGADGSVVLVEGREDTVNFIPTPFRFCLTISDTSLIGKRRAAQRVCAAALKAKGDGQKEVEALKTALAGLQ